MKLKLFEKKLIGNETFKLTFLSEEHFEIKHGQFFTFKIKSGLARSYSVYRFVKLEKGMKLEFVVKRLENGKGGSKAFSDLEIGKEIEAIGPIGHFSIKSPKKRKLFIGAGVGVVPLINLINGLKKEELKKDEIIVQMRFQKDIFFMSEISKLRSKIFLSKEEGFSFHEKGYLNGFLKLKELDFDEFYICGGRDFVNDIEKILLSMKVKKESIFKEKF